EQLDDKLLQREFARGINIALCPLAHVVGLCRRAQRLIPILFRFLFGLLQRLTQSRDVLTLHISVRLRSRRVGGSGCGLFIGRGIVGCSRTLGGDVGCFRRGGRRRLLAV